MRRLFSLTRKFGRDCDGSAAVEAGVVLPVYMALALGSLGWLFFLWQLNSYQGAVQQSARCAVITSGGGSQYCGSFDTYGATKASGLPGASSSFFSKGASSVAYTGASGPATAQTTCVTGTFVNPLLAGVSSVPAGGAVSFCRAVP